MIPIKMRVLRRQLLAGGRFAMIDLWDRSVVEQPEAVALIFEGSRFTFAEMDLQIRRAATLLAAAGFAPGARVALFGYNDPQFWWRVLALWKLGLTPVVLRREEPDQLPDFLAQFDGFDGILLRAGDPVNDAAGLQQLAGRRLEYDAEDGVDDRIEPMDDGELRARRADVSLHDVALIMGTSGTTGPPKACIMGHGALLAYVTAHHRLKRLRPDDRALNCVSVAHGQGFFSGCMVQWAAGGSTVLERDFDPDRFFEKCREHQVTVIGYCGTVPRRLLAAPTGRSDRTHGVRIAAGHEMTPDCRSEFGSRFGIPVIADYFASTEGSFFFGVRNHPTAVGVAGPLSRVLHPFKILRLDADNELVWSDRRPETCGRGEAGELATLIDDRDPLTTSAYVAAAYETETKLVGAFGGSGRWFRTGDILSIDRFGYVHFHGKRKTSFRVDGRFVNPNVVEDRLLAAGVSDLGVRDLRCVLQRHSAGVYSVRLQVSGDVDPTTLQTFTDGVLPPEERPNDIEVTGRSFSETVSFRKRRPHVPPRTEG